MLRIDNVVHGGELGSFRANADSLGWRNPERPDHPVIHSTASVRRAEWRAGALRVEVCEEGAASEVLALDGFKAEHFDELWRYFEHNCGVYVKKHRTVCEVSAEDFDAAMRGMEGAADRVDEAPSGSVPKKAREADLMKRVEGVRDGLDQAVSGDKQALSRVFSANGCERIGRLRLVVDTVALEVYREDPRWLHLQNIAATVEAVLKELGTFRPWRPQEDSDGASMMRRQMVRELRHRHGSSDGGEAADAAGSGALAPQIGRIQHGGLPPPPLQGLLPPAEAPALAPSSPVEAQGKAEARPPPPPQQPQGAAEAAGGGATEEDWDEEVTDPNAVRASAPDDRQRLPGTLSSSGGTGARRVRYIYPDSLLEGWIWKQSKHLKKWRRRWLVLMPDHFATYKARSPGGATERVDRGSVVRIYSADSEVLCTKCFCVVSAQRKVFSVKPVNFFMVCDDEAQKLEWMREIAKALGTQMG